MRRMFYYCSKVKTIYVSTAFDVSNVSNSTDMFKYTNNLV
jgi:surface protein